MVRTVIGYALTNVVLHNDEMKETGNLTMIMDDFPVLQSVVEELESVGASDTDIDCIIDVLGRNGKQDLPVQMKPQVFSVVVHGTWPKPNPGIITPDG